MSKVASLLAWSALAVLNSDICKWCLTWLDCLCKLLDSHNSFFLGSCDCFTSSSNYWISWPSMLQENVAGTHCRYEVKKLHIEYESCFRRNHWRVPGFPICILVWADQPCLLSFPHWGESFVPTPNDLTHANLTLERSTLLYWGVEDTSIFESSVVVSRDKGPCRANRTRALLYGLDLKFLLHL